MSGNAVASRAALFSATVSRKSANLESVAEAISLLKSADNDGNCGYSTMTVGDVEDVSRIDTIETGVTMASLGSGIELVDPDEEGIEACSEVGAWAWRGAIP